MPDPTFVTRSLAEAGTCQFVQTYWPARPRDPPISTSPVLGLQAALPCLTFCVCVGSLTQALRLLQQSLMPESSPHPKVPCFPGYFLLNTYLLQKSLNFLQYHDQDTVLPTNTPQNDQHCSVKSTLVRMLFPEVYTDKGGQKISIITGMLSSFGMFFPSSLLYLF